MRKLFGICGFVVLMGLAAQLQAEWSGWIKQRYQRRAQLFNPTEVKPWLSDTVSSATRKADEAGPVTEIETTWDVTLPGATLTAGFYGRILEYAETLSDNLLVPFIDYRGRRQRVELGFFPAQTFGSGLVLSDYPVAGVQYRQDWWKWSGRLFYFRYFDRSVFQGEWTTYAGLAQFLRLSRGQVGWLYSYDLTDPFSDASRSRVSSGGAASLCADWEWPNAWYGQLEVAVLKGPAFFAGLDIPLLSFMPLQARLRFMDEDFNPLLGAYTRDGVKQTHVIMRLPLNFLSETLIIRPQWGVKHTPARNLWTPGLKLECEFAESLWLEGQLVAEQPIRHWGALEHYEYTELKLLWMLHPNWVLTADWTKTFDGFLAWKEIRSQVVLEVQW